MLTSVFCPDRKLGLRRHPLHAAGRLASVLAPEADADAEDDHGGPVPVQLPRVGRQIRHREGPGALPVRAAWFYQKAVWFLTSV